MARLEARRGEGRGDSAVVELSGGEGGVDGRRRRGGDHRGGSAIERLSAEIKEREKNLHASGGRRLFWEIG